MALNRTTKGNDALVYIIDIEAKRVIDVMQFGHYKMQDSQKYTFVTPNYCSAVYYESLEKQGII